MCRYLEYFVVPKELVAGLQMLERTMGRPAFAALLPELTRTNTVHNFGTQFSPKPYSNISFYWQWSCESCDDIGQPMVPESYVIIDEFLNIIPERHLDTMLTHSIECIASEKI
jgi:hypothetical protein